MIPYGRQSINADDVQAVSEVLTGDWLTTGPKVVEFEEAFADTVNAKHAIAVSNATAALHLSLLALEIGPGDRVITSPNTFLASANCAAMVGATPDFVDIDPVSYNLDPEALRAAWSDDVRAVIAVDYAGQTADMPAIAQIARDHGAFVIEDACHAVGGQFEYEGKRWRVGGHPWADLTTFSFHPVKTMTTGEGGMITTDDARLAAKLRRLRTHGMCREAHEFTGLGDPSLDERGPWYYEMQDLGYNYRLTDFQCALGLSQLARLPAFLERRRRLVARYHQQLADLPGLTLPGLHHALDQSLTSWHLFTVQVDFASLGRSRTEVMMTLREQGIGTQVLYIPVHLQPWYRRTYGYGPGKCPRAESFYQRTLSLPLYPDMTDDDVDRVAKTLRELLRQPS